MSMESINPKATEHQYTKTSSGMQTAYSHPHAGGGFYADIGSLSPTLPLPAARAR